MTTFKVPTRNFGMPTDRVDVVFFQRNLLQWHKHVKQRISPFASNDGEEETGESLLNKMCEEQKIMRGETLKFQGREETSRRRARERHPDRGKEKVWVCRLHAALAVAYPEALRVTADSTVTIATRVGLKTLGLDHLSEANLRQVQISPNWEYLLRAETRKSKLNCLSWMRFTYGKANEKKVTLKSISLTTVSRVSDE